MTETKNTANLPEPIPVDPKKLIDGLGTIFGGVIQLLAAMEPNIAKELSDMAINGVSEEKASEEFNPDDFEEIIAADDLQWDTEPEQPKQGKPEKAAVKKEQTALTADDLIRVVTQKIKKDRSNKEKVLALLKSYRAAKVSDVSTDKYEAFLTDLSQL
ncbi:MAG: hypothetical protein NC093_10125 [Alistipes sp.]|nr:hypothetical protein [Alistipes sp.]